jgi:hypothetical protein
MNEDERGVVGGMISIRNRSTRRKSAPVTFCPPQIPYDPHLGMSPGRRDGKPANRLSYDAFLLNDIDSLRLHGRGINKQQGRNVQVTQKQDKRQHQCLECDSNLRP